MTATNAQTTAIATTDCPSCNAPAGSNCVTSTGARISPSKTHAARVELAESNAAAKAEQLAEVREEDLAKVQTGTEVEITPAERAEMAERAAAQAKLDAEESERAAAELAEQLAAVRDEDLAKVVTGGPAETPAEPAEKAQDVPAAPRRIRVKTAPKAPTADMHPLVQHILTRMAALHELDVISGPARQRAKIATLQTEVETLLTAARMTLTDGDLAPLG